LHPGIQVELHTSDEKLDLMRGEADVALRVGPMPSKAGLIIRRVGEVRARLFCSAAYAQRHGVPSLVAQLNDHTLIRGVGRVDTRPGHKWMAEHAPQARIAHRAASTDGILHAVRAGLGIGSLPSFLAPDTDLVCIEGLGPQEAVGAWLITTDEVRRRAHVRAFLDFTAPRLVAVLGV